MEQVLAPRFNFTPKNTGRQEGYDYGSAGYDPNGRNVGFNHETGQLHIEINGLAEPTSLEARRIVREDLLEVITAFVQDRPAVEQGLFNPEAVPEEQNVLRMGKIVRDRYPDLGDADQEAIRQHAVAALNLTQQARSMALDAADADTAGGNTAFLDGVRRFAMDVRDVDIDLIDSINPFATAYSILSKSMSESALKQVQAAINAKRVTIPYEEARDLALRARRFAREHGRPPDITSPDAWERRMAEGVAALKRHVEANRA